LELLAKYDYEAAHAFLSDPSKTQWICKLCLEMDTKTVRWCCQKPQKYGQTSNCQSHLEDKHGIKVTDEEMGLKSVQVSVVASKKKYTQFI
jgi:hypothetical protein